MVTLVYQRTVIAKTIKYNVVSYADAYRVAWMSRTSAPTLHATMDAVDRVHK